MLKFAERRVEEAEIDYRRTRDELARFMLQQQEHAMEEVEQV